MSKDELDQFCDDSDIPEEGSEEDEMSYESIEELATESQEETSIEVKESNNNLEEKEVKEGIEELSGENLVRLVKSLNVFRDSMNGSLPVETWLKCYRNLNSFERSLKSLKKMENIDYEIVPMLWVSRNEINEILQKNQSPIFNTRFIKLRDLLNSILSRDLVNNVLSKYKSVVPQKETMKTETDEEENIEQLEGKSEEELYRFYLERSIEKLKRKQEEKRATELELKAKSDLETFILSDGLVKPWEQKTPEEKLVDGVLDFYNEEQRKVKELKEQKRTIEQLTEKQKEEDLSDYLSGIADLISKTETKKEKRKEDAIE